MKRPAYPLAAVRRLRERRRDEARELLAQRLAALAAAQDELATRQTLLATVRDQLQTVEGELFAAQAAQAVEAHSLAWSCRGADCLRRLVVEATAGVTKAEHLIAVAEDDLETARQELAAATREVKAVEVHYERWHRRWVRLLLGREERQANEAATSGWLRRTAEETP